MKITFAADDRKFSAEISDKSFFQTFERRRILTLAGDKYRLYRRNSREPILPPKSNQAKPTSGPAIPMPPLFNRPAQPVQVPRPNAALYSMMMPDRARYAMVTLEAEQKKNRKLKRKNQKLKKKLREIGRAVNAELSEDSEDSEAGKEGGRGQ